MHILCRHSPVSSTNPGHEARSNRPTVGTTLATQCVTAFVVEYVGRRRLVFVGAIIDMICCAIIGLIGSLGKTLALKNFVIAVTLVWAVFNTFLGTLGGSYTAEAPSSRMRTRSAGLSQGFVATVGLILTIGIPYMLNPPAKYVFCS